MFSRHDAEVALRVGASVGLPLFAILAVGRLDLAVYAAFGSLTCLYGHREIGAARFETLVVAAAAMMLTIAVAMCFSASHGPHWLLSILLVATVLATGTLGVAMGWMPRGDLFFILVLLVASQAPIPWDKIPLALAVAVASASLSILLRVMWHTGEGREALRLEGLRVRLARGLSTLDRGQHGVLIFAAAVGVEAAWVLALVLGVGNPFWAPVTVAALTPALASEKVYRRAVHMVLGTLAGVGIAALLFSGNPNHFTLIAIIVICQIASELFVTRQYGIALLFLSPLAIGLSNLSRGLPWKPLLIERLIEAGLGVAVALAVILVGRRVLAGRCPQAS